MVEGGLLFTGRDAEGEPSYAHHLAQMVAVMGPPPKRLLERSGGTAEYFDGDGALREGHGYALQSLEERMMEGDDHEKAAFAAFLRKMLCWVPEERQTAKQLLEDPWLDV